MGANNDRWLGLRICGEVEREGVVEGVVKREALCLSSVSPLLSSRGPADRSALALPFGLGDGIVLWLGLRRCPLGVVHSRGGAVVADAFRAEPAESARPSNSGRLSRRRNTFNARFGGLSITLCVRLTEAPDRPWFISEAQR